MAQDISHDHSGFQHMKCEECVLPTANTSSLAAKPHQSLFNLLTISSDLIPVLITVDVLLCIGPFLCSGDGGAVFIVVPAELKGKLCSGSAKELLEDAPQRVHPSAHPGHQQEQVDARGRQK